MYSHLYKIYMYLYVKQYPESPRGNNNEFNHAKVGKKSNPAFGSWNFSYFALPSYFTFNNIQRLLYSPINLTILKWDFNWTVWIINERKWCYYRIMKVGKIIRLSIYLGILWTYLEKIDYFLMKIRYNSINIVSQCTDTTQYRVNNSSWTEICFYLLVNFSLNTWTS